MKCFLVFAIVFLLGVTKKCLGALPVSEEEYALMPPLFHLDDYDRCKLLYKEDALYCSIRMQLVPIDPKNTTKVWQVIEKMSRSHLYFKHDELRYGVCVPETCPLVPGEGHNMRNHLSNFFTKKFENDGLKADVFGIDCRTAKNNYKIDYIDVLIGLFMVSYVTFVIYASFYEGLARYQPKEVYQKITSTKRGRILAAFSIPNNWYRLTTFNENADAKALRSIQGIRFYNMICVILSHTCMGIFARPILNPWHLDNFSTHTLTMFLLNGASAVQTFFVISGWLLSYSFFVTFDENNKKRVTLKHLFLTFVIRYIRVTPTMITVVAFCATWLVHMGDGPHWNHIVGNERGFCRKNWWANLLYINNYYDVKNICVGQTWYLSADTHVVALCLIMIWLMLNNRKRIGFIIAFFVALGLFLQGYSHYVNGNHIVMLRLHENLSNFTLLDKHIRTSYLASHVNVTGYVIGVAFGYIFYKYRGQPLIGKKVIYIWLWWIYCFAVQIFIILVGVYFYEEDFTCPQYMATLYDLVSKNLFALAIGVLILGMTEKIGWFARYVLEWSAVQVLGRLTFCAYLCHLTFIKYRTALIRQPTFVTNWEIIYATIADIVVSYIIALFLSLLIEFPLSALQKIVMAPPASIEEKKEK